ncbi:cytochrome c oxidase subunit II [Agrobacterium sp. AGB01]|uniref:cytochrome c oxidase subunit II n=1 Tax=Agrobacterium sp. AGB01 TaxID=2769302 RepID=UPI0035301C41
MNRHGMKWMTGDGHCRTGRFLFEFGNDRVRTFSIWHIFSPVFRPTREALIRFQHLLVAGLATSLLSSCRSDLSTLDPAGPSASMVADLWWVMFGGAAVIFVLVMALFAMVMLRTDKVRHISAKHWIGIGGIGMPVPVLIALLIFAFFQGETLFGTNAPKPDVTITATSRMWSWEFTYTIDGDQVHSRDVLHMPVGQTVQIDTTSIDVIHSFWVPRLGGKIDSIPGQVNSIVLKADVEGTFGGICSEYCGIGHDQMSFRVNTHSPNDFEELLRNLRQ